MNDMSRPPERAPTTISTVLEHLHRLIRKEVELIRSEMAQKISRIAIALALITVAVIAVLTGLNVLAGAAVAALVGAGLSAGWAAVIVAGAFILLAAVLCAKGIAIIKTTTLAPTETVGALKSDIQTLKEKIHDA